MWFTIPICLFTLLLSQSSAEQPSAAKELIDAKCTLCHTSYRIYTTDSAELEKLVSRMTEKNPDWFREVDSRHLLVSLEAMLNEPEVSAMRVAWEKTISRGEEVFKDPQLGSNGKSCADCHSPESLVKVKDKYPKFDKDLGRIVSLDEHLNYMVVKKMEGPALKVGDERIFALSLFIKSLR